MKCTKCDKETDDMVKEVCRACYMKEYGKVHPQYRAPRKTVKPDRFCNVCGIKTNRFSLGMCRKCYAAYRRDEVNKPKECAGCHEVKLIAVGNLCGKCYQHTRRANGYKYKKTYYCECGEVAVKLYRCQKCYDQYISERPQRILENARASYYKNREHYLALSKQYHDLHKEEYNKRAKEWNIKHRRKNETNS
jgi:hypothetical protein